MKKILCFLGFHNWKYSMKPLENDRRGLIEFKHRQCLKCGKVQFFSKRPLSGNGYSDNSWRTI